MKGVIQPHNQAPFWLIYYSNWPRAVSAKRHLFHVTSFLFTPLPPGLAGRVRSVPLTVAHLRFCSPEWESIALKAVNPGDAETC